MRIRLTLDINRHRDEPSTPDVWDASNGTTERAEPHPVGFTIDGPRDPEPSEEDE